MTLRTAALLGQSNALGFASATPVPSGAVVGDLYVEGVERATYGPTNVSIEEEVGAASRVVVKRAVGGSSIAEWLSTYLPLAFRDARWAGRVPRATVWIQGEADARSDGGWATYQTDLEDLIDQIVAEWGPQVVVIPLLSGLPSGDYPRMSEVNAAISAVAASRSYVVTVATASFGKLGDNVHYTRTGYNDLGAAIAAVLAARGIWP